jgi:hypothetical protein
MHDPPRPLDARHAPLAIGPDEFRAIGHRLVDDIAALLETLPGRPVVPPGQQPADVRRALRADAPLPAHGGDPAALLREAAALDREADQLGDPADGLRFDLGCNGRQCPRADVRVDGRGEQVAQHSHRGG